MSTLSLDVLERNQRATLRQLKRLFSTVQDAKLVDTVAKCKSLLESLVEYKTEFVHTQSAIFDRLAGKNEELQKREEEYNNCLDACTQATLFLREQLVMLDAPTTPAGGSQGAESYSSNELKLILRELVNATSGRPSGATPKLPQLELPKFNGEYSNWQCFKDAFESTIHKRTDLTSSQKLQYLKLSLTDDAAKFAQHVKVTDENYQALWDGLQGQFGKKTHIVHDCIDKFLAQPKMKESSLQSLKDLTHNSKRIIWELKNLGSSYYTLDSWIIYLMKNLLDEDTRKAWEEKRADDNLATLDEWFKFLEKRIDAMELWAPKDSAVGGKQDKKPQTQPKATVKSHHTDTLKCPHCSSSHYLFQCREFKSVTLPERRRIAFNLKACYNCLRTTHIAEKCQSQSTCRDCNQKHHTLLHPDDVPAASQSPENAPPDQLPEAPVVEQSLTSHHTATQNRVLLPTALVKVADKHRQQQICRILVDTGGECSFISETCAKRLGLPRRNGRLSVNAAGEVTVAHTKGLISAVLTSLHDPGEHIQTDVYVLSKLTSLFPTDKIVEPPSWQHLRTLQLADPTFDTPGEIDIILGGDYALAINLPQIIHSESGVPVAQLTIFGWILGGKIGDPSRSVTSFHSTLTLNNSLTPFWEIEDSTHPEVNFLTEQEQITREHSVDVSNTSNSQAILALEPMTMDPVGNELALEEFIEHDKSDGFSHMATSGPPSKSSHSKHFFSISDVLAIVPTIQQDVVSHLFNFRTTELAFLSEIEERHRQGVVAPPNGDYQRILRRDSTQDAIHEYRLTKSSCDSTFVSYISAKFLPLSVLGKAKDFSKSSRVIPVGFYMYGYSRTETLESARKLRLEIQTTMARSEFQKQKLSSNSSAVLSEIPSDDLAVTPADVNHCSKSFSAPETHWSQDGDTHSRAPGSVSALNSSTNVSEKGSAAVTHARGIDQDSTHQVKLLALETRVVAPKLPTIPRLKTSYSFFHTSALKEVKEMHYFWSIFIIAWLESTIGLNNLPSHPAIQSKLVASGVNPADGIHHLASLYPVKRSPAIESHRPTKTPASHEFDSAKRSTFHLPPLTWI
ncbi:uncharacterized protein LOC129787390 [Lutzomyia longipalpis]|uniref:uncharacterized protein LOC129787390 n=1 Tax=Lutzomyia longipalpis TaxID=7200 RepID=UPI002483373F|nr:uncharacterized protein LOC129787390 [Lutzomyia longipalpis]XP_055678909.1 uncharacterized protein LOC129787390 [Lutzomyia longipalpis]XP_055678910.1 uncharacterized protein LOC129787390 [Lutzomyia longipalpis]XP_055678911.1 uncharacterized protein LOC129787390 [Lutzomyia longipalpis]XP_055678912.1 uncharacterized protein LOC129787390 [Lutzomyia longipalpis]XP_055678913.1 uncharacterized protein LOC129787390 [Lutzomyia longipalpis]XP_055678914.1 uncharacterized protein LOC129787390 [Lutzom